MRIPEDIEKFPVLQVLHSLIDSLRINPITLLEAPPGAGKSTVLPLHFLDQDFLNDKNIIIIEPRRLAAKSVAARLSEQLGEPIGKSVGYKIRFEGKYSSETKILVVTEGIFINLLQRDPGLTDTTLVILDEFHERSIESDLLLGMARLLQKTVRQDLKILVMSATLDSHKVSAYMDECQVISSLGKMYPVEISYSTSKKDIQLEEAVSSEVYNIQQKTGGDILVFLSGMYEILSSKKQLEKQFPGLDIHILHGDLPIEVQEKSLKKAPRDRVILSTNVAETSVTVNGVRAVIDSGQAKKSFFDSRLGLNSI
jgi:ATP-dependent helicase HrpB